MNRFSRHLYRLSLYAYPREFRKKYGREMVQALDESMALYRTKKGRFGKAQALCAILIDGLKTALLEHWQMIRISESVPILVGN